ncbi:hypothetical protein ABIB85_004297 [Bradyrhizobium sp. JR1.5]
MFGIRRVATYSRFSTQCGDDEQAPAHDHHWRSDRGKSWSRHRGTRELLAWINPAPTSAMRQHGQLAFRSLANLSRSLAARANSDKGGLAPFGAALWQPEPGWLRLTRRSGVAPIESPLRANKELCLRCRLAAAAHACAVWELDQGGPRHSAKADLAALPWSVDPQDRARPGVEAIVAAVLASVQPGAIVLLHDGCPPDELGRRPDAGRRDQTVMALAQLIPALHDRGFAIRSLRQPNRIDQCP